MIRANCGTLAGLLAHQSAGEPACGWCARAEAIARVTAEGIPTRPTSAGPPSAGSRVRPVTVAEATRNREVLAAEEAEWRKDHPGWSQEEVATVARRVQALNDRAAEVPAA